MKNQVVTNFFQKIPKNFSKAVSSYDYSAKIQKQSAFSLISKLKQLDLPEGPLWEIGCGTGILTKHLLTLFPNKSVRLSDLSDEMLGSCQKMLRKENLFLPGSSFILENAEYVYFRNLFSLIISNCTFHWFTSLSKALSTLMNALIPGGSLLFSCFEEGSFLEWKKICHELSLPFTGNLLPSFNDLRFSFPFSFEKQTFCVHFSSAKEFFWSLKQIGAHTKLHSSQLTFSQMKQLQNHWDRQYSQGIEVTYSILFGLYTKTNSKNIQSKYEYSPTALCNSH